MGPKICDFRVISWNFLHVVIYHMKTLYKILDNLKKFYGDTFKKVEIQEKAFKKW